MKLTQAFVLSVIAGAILAAAIAPIGPAEVSAQSRAPKISRAKGMPKSGTLRFVAILESAGINAVELTGRMDGRYFQALKRAMRARGAADVSVFEIGDRGNGAMHVMVVLFEDQEALQRVVDSKQPLIRVADCVILPASKPNDAWQLMVEAVAPHGGTENSFDVLEPATKASDAATVLSRLETIRAHIEIFAVSNQNAVPDFKSSGWKQLIDAGHFEEPPVNVMSEPQVATNVVVISNAGADGRGVPLTKAGWVWNSADKTMHPAGISEDELNQIMDADRLDTSAWLMPPEILIKGMLGEARIALAEFYMNHAEGHERFPTLQELIDGRTEMTSIPRNPFNGNPKVQAATWRKNKPPIGGDAGWNYDEKEGKFWANTGVAGENEW